jgi:hypothetical protein
MLCGHGQLTNHGLGELSGHVKQDWISVPAENGVRRSRGQNDPRAGLRRNELLRSSCDIENWAYRNTVDQRCTIISSIRPTENRHDSGISSVVPEA